MSSGLFKNVIHKIYLQIIYLICMYKKDLLIQHVKLRLKTDFVSDPAHADGLNLHIYIYIYIVIHRHTVSFYHNSSVWLDAQNAPTWDRNPPSFMLHLVSNCSYIYTTH